MASWRLLAVSIAGILAHYAPSRRASLPQGVRESAADSLVPSVRQACNTLAKAARRFGAARIVRVDTVLEADGIEPPEWACVVRVGGFELPARADVFRRNLPAPDWSWHPFDGDGGDTTYAVVTAGVQCEVEYSPRRHPRGASQIVTTEQFHLLCYKD